MIRQRWALSKIHISWIIASLGLGVILGTGLVAVTNLFVSPLWYIAASILILSCVLWPRNVMVLVAILGGMIIGQVRGGHIALQLDEYQDLIGNTVIMRGKIAEDVSYGPKGDARIRVSSVVIDNKKYTGVLWVSSNNASEVKRGDVVTIKGKLSEGFGTIPASMFAADIVSVTRPIPGDIGRQARDGFAKGLDGILSPIESELALGYLVGKKLEVDDTFADNLKTIGLVHAVVASGYHLTVLVGVIRRLFEKRSKYLTALTGFLVIGGFILITGFSPSMTRAGIVSGLGLLAWYYGRRAHPVVLILFVASLTVLINPAYMWGDLGWYLSFLSFIGVLVLAPLLHHYFWGLKRPSVMREVVVATISAQLLTLPLLLLTFGYTSAYALLANVLVVPLVPLVMLATFIIGMLGLTVPLIAGWLSVPLSWVLQYMIGTINYLSALPYAKIDISFGVPALIFGYILIAIVIVGLRIRLKHNFRTHHFLQKIL